MKLRNPFAVFQATTGNGFTKDSNIVNKLQKNVRKCTKALYERSFLYILLLQEIICIIFKFYFAQELRKTSNLIQRSLVL